MPWTETPRWRNRIAQARETVGITDFHHLNRLKRPTDQIVSPKSGGATGDLWGADDMFAVAARALQVEPLAICWVVALSQ